MSPRTQAHPTRKAESSLVTFFKEHLESNRQAMEQLGHPQVPRTTEPMKTPANQDVTPAPHG